MYENNGINLRYATGEKESLNYSISMPIFLSSQELILLIFSISIGIISCIIPAFNVYKMNISKTLTDE